MAANDTILLDGILEQRLTEGLPSTARDEVFEYFAFEQLLKQLDPSSEDIQNGWVDGRDDGGVDGFFIAVNGHLLDDPDNFPWPKRNAHIEVWIITCKHHDTFRQATLDSLLATLPDLLRLSASEPTGNYSGELIRSRELLRVAYRRLSSANPSITFHLAYASRGDSEMVAPSIRARADQLVEAVRSLFSSCEARFSFVGSTELVALHRQTKTFSLSLPFVEHLSAGKGSHVLLVKLSEYFAFLKDANGSIRKYLFESNVRDYLDHTGVNEDITTSLKDGAAPDFWWLNNGITMLATAATVVDKQIALSDVQIVNGLQTSETVFDCLCSGDTTSTNKLILIKAIVSSEPRIRDYIIRATNNQNVVATASLRATDKIQRDIEDILVQYDWYYERRTNDFRYKGKPQARFVTPIYLASAYVSLVIKNPAKAARLRSRFMRDDNSYRQIFSEGVPIDLWPAIVQIMKSVEQHLELIHPRFGRGDRFRPRWRHLVALLSISRLLGRFSYGANELIGVTSGDITMELVRDSWEIVDQSMEHPSHMRSFGKPSFAHKCCHAFADKYGVLAPQAIGRIVLPTPPPPSSLSDEILSSVNSVLPRQPWKPGIHKVVAQTLNLDADVVYSAIRELVRRGLRNHQREGIVYDKSGNILTIDPEQEETGIL